MQYAILIYGMEDLFERLPENEQDAAMARHRELQREHGAKGTLGAVARLMGTSAAVTVKKRGDSVLVLDGPFAETKEQLLGLYIFLNARVSRMRSNRQRSYRRASPRMRFVR